MPTGESVMGYVNQIQALKDLTNVTTEGSSQEGSILDCDLNCAKEECLDLFKKKTPFQVSMGCIRSTCKCHNLDLSKNAYKSFMRELSLHVQKQVTNQTTPKVEPEVAPTPEPATPATEALN